jgi:hypothetical protein
MEDTMYGRLVVTDPDVPEGVIKMHPDTAALVLRMHRMFSVPVTVANLNQADHQRRDVEAAFISDEDRNLMNGGGEFSD